MKHGHHFAQSPLLPVNRTWEGQCISLRKKNRRFELFTSNDSLKPDVLQPNVLQPNVLKT